MLSTLKDRGGIPGQRWRTAILVRSLWVAPRRVSAARELGEGVAHKRQRLPEGCGEVLDRHRPPATVFGLRRTLQVGNCVR